MAFLEIMTKFNSACVFETVLHMAFIEIMRIKDLFSVCDNYSCPRASSFNLYLCVCVGMLGSKNSIRSMQAMNAMKVRKRQASGFQNFIGAMRAKNAIKVRKRPASRAAPSAPKSKKGTKAMEAGNGPPNDAGRLLHYGTTIPVGQGPAWIRDMALSEEIGSGTEWIQVNVGGGIKTVMVKKFTKIWAHLDGHVQMHPGVGAPNNWYRKDLEHKRLGMDFALLQTENAKLKAKLAELEKRNAESDTCEVEECCSSD